MIFIVFNLLLFAETFGFQNSYKFSDDFNSAEIQAQPPNRFKFLKPFQDVHFGSEDIGLSVEWTRLNQLNSFGIGGYYSAQTSALGAGVWFHGSGFGTVMMTPDQNDVELMIGVNGGVSFLLLEAKVHASFTQDRLSFVPAIGLGINRIAYFMADYYVRQGANDWGMRLVFRLPVFTRADKNVSGFTPAYN